MKNIKLLFVAILLILVGKTHGQEAATNSIKGKVVDNQGVPLPGANVIEKGTSNGSLTDFDGMFEVATTSDNGILVISYVGFGNKEITYSASTKDLGTIMLGSGSVGLEEVMIVASVAVDRKTPVAVSTIKADDIELKLGTQEFPEVLKSTPGVYATKAGGGFGDAETRIRGFDSQNVAVMINGIPVNDMENGRVFWSNWAGLSDVTSSMQVQRGLGASKVAVPSIGGTINVITKTTDVEKGGNVRMSIANDGYQKYGFKLSTGLMDNGFAATVLASRTFGNGYVDGTEFNSVSYFANISKEINDRHTLAFTVFGAKQRHGQRQSRSAIQDYRDSESGRKYNPDWGYKNGEVTHIEDNFYHKPQMSLNHYWDISDKTSLSNVAYFSTGTGGGGGTAGDDRDKLTGNFNGVSYRRGSFGPVDIDRIVDENIANGANGSSAILRASRNDHTWYGLLSTLKTDLTESLTLLGGVDLRHYRGRHFQEVTDLLGGQFFLSDDDVNNPNNAAQVGDKINFNNDGIVDWAGLFTQLEYSKDNLSAFLSLAGSNTSYKRVDFFNKLDSDPTQETDRVDFTGYSVKGGVNYNFDSYQNVFANIGYFERAPDFRSVWPTFDNDEVNDDAENQKIFSAELGYGVRTEKFSANINVYRTEWNDRTEVVRFQQPDGSQAFANLLGVNALHQGVEFDFKYKPFDFLTFTGMVSVGDWKWQENITDVDIINEDQDVVSTVDIFIEKIPVADAAQTTSALGVQYKFLSKTTLTLDYNYYDRLYADFDPSDRNEADALDPWELPSYSLFDAALRHSFKIGSLDATITGRVNNVFDTEYISDAQDSDGTAAGASVWFGYGRTFSVGTKINF
ncbi:TonB-dependent receptor [Aquimarina sp. 2304DJ70-9]|uniref:TonB-dependent receptor n=1 Tax=Aquimarina penaris TaxID=3231044 RepID=UPI00346191EC